MSVVDSERIVESEVRRIHITGYDDDDLRQEARLACHRAVERLRQREGSKSYVRTAVRNELRNLLRNAHSLGRFPHDENGQRLHRAHKEWLDDVTPSGDSSPEAFVVAKQLVEHLKQRAPKETEIVMRAVMDGADVARGVRRGTAVQKDLDKARTILALILNQLSDNRTTRARKGRVVQEDTMTSAETKIPTPDPSKLPECHADGTDPMHYDPAEPGCRLTCLDKFSCLPRSIDKGAVGDLTVEDDHEVADVLSGELTFQEGQQRVQERDRILRPGGKGEIDATRIKLIPASLLVRKKSEMKGKPTASKSAPETKPVEETAEEPQTTTEDSTQEDAMATKKTKKIPKKSPKAATSTAKPETKADAPPPPPAAATKKKPLKKPVKAKAEPAAKKAKTPLKKPVKPAKAAPKAKEPKARKKGSGHGVKLKESFKLKPNPNGKGTSEATWPTVIAGGKLKKLPAPDALKPEELEVALKRAKLGTPFKLAVGMIIIRHRREGGDVKVEIRKDGFFMDGKTYTSLTACAMWAERRMRSGNDYFSVETHDCVEITGKGVPNNRYARKTVATAA